MHPEWQKHLIERGAVIEDRVLRFRNPEKELAAAASGTVLVDLSHFALLSVSGEDARIFLHKLTTNDLYGLEDGQVELSAFCSIQGRMLALFSLLRRSVQDYLLQFPAELFDELQKKFSFYRLRSKVEFRDAGLDLARFVLAGKDAATLIAEHFPALPEISRSVENGPLRLLRLAEDCFEILAPPIDAAVLWNRLAPHAVEAGAPVYEWLEISAGLPQVFAETSGSFVPQMMNLDILGGISFRKGCYPGQEVVARTQYLGKLKRAMIRARVSAEAKPGDEIYSGPEKAGTVARSAPSLQGGSEILAVVLLENDDLRLVSGEPLEKLTLPYLAEKNEPSDPALA